MTKASVYGLASGVLSSFETLAQAVAGVAPSAVPAMTVAIVFSMAGNGAWLSYVIATGIALLTAFCINVYASRSSSPGSIYTYVTTGGGAPAGFVSGWAMLCAYLLGVATCTLQFAIFAAELFKDLGLSPPSLLVLATGCVVCTGWIACKNVKLSAELMLWLEVLSLCIIAVLCLLVLSHTGWHFDFSQVKLTGASMQGVCLGVIMALFGFVGFESAATLGSEAEAPLQKIPRALLTSVISAGVFFVFCTYAIVLAFKGCEQNLATCTTPLLAMSDSLSMSWLGKLTNLGAAASFFACTLAATNAAARIMLSMAYDGFFHERLRSVDRVNKTPVVAVIIASVFGFAPGAILAMRGYTALDIVGWLGTVATYGYLVAYFLIALTCCFYLRKIGELKPASVILAICSGASIIAAVVGSMYQVPPGVYSWLPYLFLTYLGVGICYFWGVKAFRRPVVLGSSVPEVRLDNE